MTDEKNVLKLETPIEIGGETISELSFKEPTVLQIEKCGMPVRYVDGGIDLIHEVCSKYISTLGEIPPSAVRKMSRKDFMRAMGIVAAFFGD